MLMPILTPGKSGFLKNREGITLIELLVTLAIVGAMLGLATVGLRGILDVELKNASRELASLTRYIRSKAVIENRHLRLVLDMEKSQYWVEASNDPHVISIQEEIAGPAQEERDEEEKEVKEPKRFAELEDSLVRRRKLGGGVFFKDVSVSYLPAKREEGKVHLYFFPDGYATEAVINLRDEEDQNHYSIEILALSTRIKIEGEYREMER